jgi:hypothetical protein
MTLAQKSGIILYPTLFCQTLRLLRRFSRQLYASFWITGADVPPSLSGKGTPVFGNPITWLLARSLMTLHFVSNLRSELVNR